MEHLLRIQSKPIQYELKIHHAQLRWNSQQSHLEMHRTPGGFSMKNRPAKLIIDSTEARNSVCPTLSLAIKQAAAKGVQAADQYIQKSSKEASMLVKDTPAQDILKSLIADRASYPTGDFELAFLPTTGPDIQYQEGQLSMEYQKDRLEFDVRISHGNLEYTPGSVEMNITQWPDVIIEYIGKPLYIPPRDDAFSARA